MAPEARVGERERAIAAWIAVSLALALADQIVKHVALELLRPGEVWRITGFFNVVLVFNRGAAFSFLADAAGWQRELLAAIAVIASVVIVALIVRSPFERLFCAGLALILGGALGNLWDRIALGYVVDFLDFHAFGWHWPAFNLADSAISIGAVLLIADGFRAGKPKRR